MKRRHFLGYTAAGALLHGWPMLARSTQTAVGGSSESAQKPAQSTGDVSGSKAGVPNTDSHLPVDPQPIIEINEGDDIAAAVATINASGKGTIIWGKGTFRIPAVSPQFTVLNFTNLSSFKMYGQGAGQTVLIQDISPENARGQLRLCALQSVASFDISHFSIDGQNARYELPGSPKMGENEFWKSKGEEAYTLHNNREAMSSFFVRKVRNGRFRHLHNISARGDFVNMANARDIIVFGCDIADCGRNGITLGGQRGLEWSHNVEIDSCLFRSDIDTQMIDLELHGTGTANESQLNKNVYVHHCEFEVQTPDDALDVDQFAIVMNEVLGFRIEHCNINGPVIVRNAQGSISDNSGGISQFTMDRDSTADIRRTVFKLTPKQRDANRNLAGIYVARRDDISPRQFILRECDISASDLTTAVEIHNCRDVSIKDNFFSMNGVKNAMYLQADADNMTVNIAGNSGLAVPVSREKNGAKITMNIS